MDKIRATNITAISNQSDGGTETVTSRRTILKLLGIGVATSSIGIGTATAERSSQGGPIFEFKQMVGNTLTGSDGVIRGVNAGGLPWVIDEAEAKLDADGLLKVEVEGLVLAEEDPVPEELQGTNPISNFRATVSCLTLDDDEHVTENVQTGEYAATTGGDAEIEETLDLPEPCLAPIVFVTHPNGVWFATTGF